jgi:hypothetical protein
MQSAYGRVWVAAESRHAMSAKGFADGKISVMVKRITLFRIICFCLLAACAASCQSEPAVGEGLRGLQSSGNDRQRQESGARRLSPGAPLPDAPMPSTLAAQPSQFQTDSVRSALDVSGRTQADNLAPLFPRSAGLFYTAPDQASAKKDSGFFLNKYLYPATLPQGSRYQASASDGLFARATDAASRIFWTRDLSGARRLNTSYFLRVATAIAADTASRPYWRRSASAPISDFGSTIGNDAGMNVLHEFGPSLQQAVTTHMPRFIARIEQRILQDVNQQNPHSRAAGGSPSR